MDPATVATVDELLLQTTALADAVAAVDPATPVPTCPDWSVRDLARHVGRVHRRVAATIVAGDRLVSPDEVDDGEPPPRRDETGAWLLAGGALVAGAVRERAPGREVAGFAGPVPVAFWTRRMVHETLVHRLDAELAAGTPTWSGVTPALAADAIAESFALIDTYGFHWPALAGRGETVHVHATDEPTCEWVVTRATDGVRFEARHAKGDVAVRGPATGLLALLTNRRDAADAGVEVLGDAAVLAAWLRASAT